MKKIGLILGLFFLLLGITSSVNAACVLSGFTFSCGDQNPVRCPVSADPTGRRAGATWCCSSQDACDAKKEEARELMLERTGQQTAREAKIEDLCKFAGSGEKDCMRCFGKGEAWTAIGCIQTTPEGFIKSFLGLGVGIAGGIAFLLILFSGFQMMTSAGNPEKLNAGKELMTSAISGLVLIVFSIFLLRLIGVEILGLPEFK